MVGVWGSNLVPRAFPFFKGKALGTRLVGEGLLFHFILFKMADYRESAIFVAYRTLKTR